jgi:hypothetical protein
VGQVLPQSTMGHFENGSSAIHPEANLSDASHVDDRPAPGAAVGKVATPSILCPPAGGLQIGLLSPNFHLLFLGASNNSVSLDVLDEGAKLRHNLMSARMIKENARRERSKWLQQGLQFTFGDKLRPQWGRYLGQPYSCDGGTDQRWEIVSDVGAVYLDLELVPSVFESPCRNRAVGTTPPEACVIA